MKTGLFQLVAIALVLFLTGCAIVPKETTPQTCPTASQTVPPETTLETTLETSSTAKDPFEGILLGGKSFFHREQGKDMTLTEFCEYLGTIAETKVSFSNYAFADLDADGSPELLLGIVFNDELAYGTLVLHCGDVVTGYEFTYRQLMDVKQDGTFRYSGGAADNGIARLEFTQDGWEYRIIGSMESREETVSYFWDGQRVDQDTYNSHLDTHYFKDNIIRIPYPCE